jgi:hypothetical protein
MKRRINEHRRLFHGCGRFVLIGESASAEVLKYLTEAEIESISRAISMSDPLPRRS